MSLVLEVVGVLAGGAAAVAVVTLLVIGLARRQARVSPRHATGAPVRWLVAPSRAASLHRRLRAAVGALRATVPAPRRRIEPSMLQELAAAIEELAAHTDRTLVLAASASGARRTRMLRAAAVEVARVEALADRLRAVAAELDPAALDGERWHRQAARIDLTLSNFEQAGDELRSLEADWPEDLIRRKATR